MGIAGLWSWWKSPKGDVLHSYTMLTINGFGFDPVPGNNAVAFTPAGTTGTVTASTATTLTVTSITGLTAGTDKTNDTGTSLGALSANGGPTRTRALLVGSSAIDAPSASRPRSATSSRRTRASGTPPVMRPLIVRSAARSRNDSLSGSSRPAITPARARPRTVDSGRPSSEAA